MNTKRGKLRVGTSGYQYDHWRDVFYPNDLPKKDWFMYYATHFDTVEINNTFYRLPSADTFAEWRGHAPRGFCYALKFSRYGSHLKRLTAPQEPIRTFLDRAAHLKNHLGPILVQLPPHWDINLDRLAGFLRAAPRAYRWAIEFRDPRWLCEAVFTLLRQHHAALCIHDLLEDHPRLLTADWVYLRFHGGKTGGNYPPHTLSAQAKRIRQYLAQGRDVFAYFNNDAQGYAVRNAADLKRLVATPSSSSEHKRLRRLHAECINPRVPGVRR
jgi:uncharacterized protein YecE (DUF72 family)